MTRNISLASLLFAITFAYTAAAHNLQPLPPPKEAYSVVINQPKTDRQFKKRVLKAFLNRYPGTYRHIDRLFPTATVKPSKEYVFPLLPYKTPLKDVEYTFEGQEYNFNQFRKRNKLTGILILQDGRIAMEKYYCRNSKRSKWFSFSVAKPITTTLIGVAIKDGYISSIDDYASKYLPELKNTAYEKITIRNLLKMNSGIKWNEGGEDSSKLVTAIFSGKKGAIDDLLKHAVKDVEPGVKFNYNTTESYLLGEILRAATGKTVSTYLSKRIWSQFGMEKKAYWLLDQKKGKEISGAGISMTLRDYGRFGMFILNDGHLINGESILPHDWIKDSTTIDSNEKPYLTPTGVVYGYHWWIFPNNKEKFPYHEGAFIAQGLYGQFIYINPNTKTVVVIWSFWKEPVRHDKQREVYAFLSGVVQALSQEAD